MVRQPPDTTKPWKLLTPYERSTRRAYARSQAMRRIRKECYDVWRGLLREAYLEFDVPLTELTRPEED